MPLCPTSNSKYLHAEYLISVFLSKGAGRKENVFRSCTIKDVTWEMCVFVIKG
jgi:hypothetical protein